MNPPSDSPTSTRHGKRPMVPSTSSSSESSSSSSSERRRSAIAESERSEAVNAECFVCGRRFGAWKALYGHMRCHPEREWRGVKPLAEGEGSSRGRRKWRRTTGDEAAPLPEQAAGHYRCGECSRVFETRQALGGHRASHRGVRGCSAKAKETTSAAMAAMAVMREGGDEGSFVCLVCERQFGSYHGMRVHQKVHRERAREVADVGREERGFAVDLNLPPPPEVEEEEEDKEAADKQKPK